MVPFQKMRLIVFGKGSAMLVTECSRTRRKREHVSNLSGEGKCKMHLNDLESAIREIERKLYG